MYLKNIFMDNVTGRIELVIYAQNVIANHEKNWKNFKYYIQNHRFGMDLFQAPVMIIDGVLCNWKHKAT